ncbi:MAG: hypothetical protein LBB23_01735 [Rickettsiales bacterium]|nr:hypothetical protein [Rickettsiales bacterium]
MSKANLENPVRAFALALTTQPTATSCRASFLSRQSRARQLLPLPRLPSASTPSPAKGTIVRPHQAEGEFFVCVRGKIFTRMKIMWKSRKIFIIIFALCIVPFLSRAEDEFFDSGFDIGADAGGEYLEGDITSSSENIDFEMLGETLALNAGESFANVHDFDISSIMLGMPFESVRILFFREAAIYRPATRNAITYTIPKEWKSNLDYECRQQKINAPAQLEKCINSAARKRGFLYPSEMRLERPSTGEKISVHFTSNATDNLVWKIIYTNDVDDIPGDAEKFTNQRDKKVLAFWQMVLQKYGTPNSGQGRWISSDLPTDPLMDAGYGKLTLIDWGLYWDDDQENLDDALERFKSKQYAF